MQKMAISSIKKSSRNKAIRLFSVSSIFNNSTSRCLTSRPSMTSARTQKTCLHFSSFDFQMRTEHGDFDLKTGIFSVGTPGFYQMELKIDTDSSQYGYSGRVELIVDGVAKAIFHSVRDYPVEKSFSNSVILLLKTEEGQLYGLSSGSSCNYSYSVSVQFSGTLLADNSSDESN